MKTSKFLFHKFLFCWHWRRCCCRGCWLLYVLCGSENIQVARRTRLNINSVGLLCRWDVHGWSKWEFILERIFIRHKHSHSTHTHERTKKTLQRDEIVEQQAGFVLVYHEESGTSVRVSKKDCAVNSRTQTHTLCKTISRILYLFILLAAAVRRLPFFQLSLQLCARRVWVAVGWSGLVWMTARWGHLEPSLNEECGSCSSDNRRDDKVSLASGSTGAQCAIGWEDERAREIRHEHDTYWSMLP